MSQRISFPRKGATLILVLAALGLFLAGCSDDSPTTTGRNDAETETGVFHVDIAADDVAFEFVSAKNGDPDDPVEGPFAIRGRNIRYDEGALVVDLSVVNLGDDTFHEPVTLTFLSLLPEGVEVLNPDNDEHGSGAAIEFVFENDDGQWTPREESLGRETRFDVEEGTSIGFVARLDVGADTPTQGSIGGMVWNDANGDGIMETGEAGVAGAELVLSAEGMDAVRTLTAEDGTYSFEGLDSGFYKVVKSPAENMVPTTATVIYVVLVQDGGAVVSFMAANFGCQEEEAPSAVIEGTVWNDLDGDGDRDDGEPGLEGLTVELGGDATGTTTTSADGDYAFEGLSMGSYTVTSTGSDGWVATTPTEMQVVLVADDEVFDEASFGWMEEAGSPTAVIKGIVWNDLNGDGVVNDGEPGIEGATVALSLGATATETTDADGGYAFTDLAAGDYVVTCTGPDGWAATTDSELRITLASDDEVFDEASFGWWAPVFGTR